MFQGLFSDLYIHFQDPLGLSSKERDDPSTLEETKGLFTWREEDPSARKIQKADHPSAICFLYSVYMQNVVLGPSA